MIIESDVSAEAKRGCAKRRLFKLERYGVIRDGYGTMSLKPLGKQKEYGCKHSIVFLYDQGEVHETGTVVGDQLGIDYSKKGANENHPIHPVT